MTEDNNKTSIGSIEKIDNMLNSDSVAVSDTGDIPVHRENSSDMLVELCDNSDQADEESSLGVAITCFPHTRQYPHGILNQNYLTNDQTQYQQARDDNETEGLSSGYSSIVSTISLLGAFGSGHDAF